MANACSQQNVGKMGPRALCEAAPSTAPSGVCRQEAPQIAVEGGPGSQPRPNCSHSWQSTFYAVPQQTAHVLRCWPVLQITIIKILLSTKQHIFILLMGSSFPPPRTWLGKVQHREMDHRKERAGSASSGPGQVQFPGRNLEAPSLLDFRLQHAPLSLCLRRVGRLSLPFLSRTCCAPLPIPTKLPSPW